MRRCGSAVSPQLAAMPSSNVARVKRVNTLPAGISLSYHVPTSARVAKNSTEGPSRQPMPV